MIYITKCIDGLHDYDPPISTQVITRDVSRSLRLCIIRELLITFLIVYIKHSSKITFIRRSISYTYQINDQCPHLGQIHDIFTKYNVKFKKIFVLSN